jgi:hypothetical protein
MKIRKLTFLVFVLVVAIASSSRAVQYGFLPVSSTGTYTSQFTSSNGVINVTDAFPTNGSGLQENLNNLIFPSDFSSLPIFAGTGQVQGHLAQTLYGATSSVTMNLINYNFFPSTAFGIWNITDEVTPPVGGNFVYQLALFDINNNSLPLTSLNYLGNVDNTSQVNGRHQLDLNTSTGELSPGVQINNGNGIHTNAIFWDNIPQNTATIVIYGDLPPINVVNPYGDGVGYYFAEVVPEPSTIALLSLGVLGLLARRRFA